MVRSMFFERKNGKKCLIFNEADPLSDPAFASGVAVPWVYSDEHNFSVTDTKFKKYWRNPRVIMPIFQSKADLAIFPPVKNIVMIDYYPMNWNIKAKNDQLTVNV
jgi:hypothetical protein